MDILGRQERDSMKTIEEIKQIRDAQRTRQEDRENTHANTWLLENEARIEQELIAHGHFRAYIKDAHNNPPDESTLTLGVLRKVMKHFSDAGFVVSAPVRNGSLAWDFSISIG